MKPLLVLFEDSGYEPLWRAIWRVCLDNQPNLHGQRPPFTQPAGGDGGFRHFIQNDWPIFATRGMGHSGPISQLLCVIDLDQAYETLGVTSPPEPPDATDEWSDGAREQFEHKLLKWNTVQGTDVHGEVLRWNSESVLLAACFDKLTDNELWTTLAQVSSPSVKQRERFEDFLSGSCKLAGDTVDPREAPDAAFVDRWHKPGDCLKRLLKATGIAPLGKSDNRRIQLINHCKPGSRHLQQLAARVPDLATIASRIVELVKD